MYNTVGYSLLSPYIAINDITYTYMGVLIASHMIPLLNAVCDTSEQKSWVFWNSGLKYYVEVALISIKTFCYWIIAIIMNNKIM